ncbi:MAG: hypothetical protein C4547_15435 [Phycisphaerales bacterium]|nr:MAG: hypothetical protein C4547_15435 [Phycisphaerales bacterium]
MEQNGIFSRMVQRLKAPRERGGNGNGAVIAEPDAEAGAIVRSGRRERTELTLEKLQEGYHKVVGLVESIQGHMDVQEQRTRQLVEAMSALSESVRHLPAETRRQTEALDRVATQFREEAVERRRLDERMLGAQSESDARVAQTLEHLSGSVGGLSEATHSSAAALRKMHADAAERDERLAVLFTEQTRRFTYVFSFAITLAVIAAAIGVVALLRS